jgi:hypothetical protein
LRQVQVCLYCHQPSLVPLFSLALCRTCLVLNYCGSMLKPLSIYLMQHIAAMST